MQAPSVRFSPCESNFEALWAMGARPDEILLAARGPTDMHAVRYAVERALERGEDFLAAALIKRLAQTEEHSDERPILIFRAVYEYWAGNVDRARSIVRESVNVTTNDDYVTLYWSGRIESLFDPYYAEALLKRALHVAEKRSLWARVAQAASGLSRALLLQGRYRDAWSMASWALRLAKEIQVHNQSLVLDVAHSFGKAGLFVGQVRGLENVLLEALSQGAHARSVYKRHVFLSLVNLSLACGKLPDAEKYWSAAIKGVRSRTAMTLLLVPEVRLRLELGDPPLNAVDAVAGLVPHATAWLQRYVTLARGMALADTSPEHALSELQAARLAFASERRAPELARATLYLAGVLQRLGRAEDALQVLDDAGEAVAELSEAALSALAGPARLRPRLQKVGLLELYFLGGIRARFLGKEVQLSLKQAEILVALVDANRGLSSAELAERVWSESVSPVVVRNQIARLRSIVPVRSKPYALSVPVWADFLELRALLKKGEVHAALMLYKPQLLPKSEAPVVEELRGVLREEMKQAVIATGDAKLILQLADLEKDDPELWEAAAQAWPEGTVCRAMSKARLRTSLASSD